MKIRNGFVSNSSSSSFLIITKKELDEKLLQPVFGVEKKSFFYDFGQQLIKEIINKAKRADLKYLVEEYNLDEMPIPDYLEKAIKENSNLYIAQFSNNEGEIEEMFLGNTTLKYEDENIQIIPRG